jgi:putative membrane protein
MEPLAPSSLPRVQRNGDLSSHIPQAWPRIFAATLVAIGTTVAHLHFGLNVPAVGPIPFTTLGVGISIFLGFRNNQAYNRFWEARTLWGAHINSSRAFARQVMTLVASDSHNLRAFQEDVIMATIAYAHSFKNLLQDDDQLDGIGKLMLPAETAWLKTQKNVPIAILHIIGRRLATARSEGWITQGATMVMESTLNDITNVQGGCERIKNTPVPETYGHLSRIITTSFCLALPFGLLSTAGWLSPVVVFVVAYAFCGLDALGDEVAQPFGHDPHDLPLEKYTETIETNLRQILSEESLPDIDAGTERPPVVGEGAIY